jgi:predicted transposase YbfD/YdcC
MFTEIPEVFLYHYVVDFCKSINNLTGIGENELEIDAYSSHQLNSERLNGIIKNHWAVENSLH